MRAAMTARLAALEGAGGGSKPPDPERMAVARAAVIAVASIGGYSGRRESWAEAVARALGLSAADLRAMLRDRPGAFWPAVRAVLAAEAERRGVEVDALLLEAVALEIVGEGVKTTNLNLSNLF